MKKHSYSTEDMLRTVKPSKEYYRQNPRFPLRIKVNKANASCLCQRDHIKSADGKFTSKEKFEDNESWNKFRFNFSKASLPVNQVPSAAVTNSQTSSAGTQVNFYHCKDCRHHLKYGKAFDESRLYTESCLSDSSGVSIVKGPEEDSARIKQTSRQCYDTSRNQELGDSISADCYNSKPHELVDRNSTHCLNKNEAQDRGVNRSTYCYKKDRIQEPYDSRCSDKGLGDNNFTNTFKNNRVQVSSENHNISNRYENNRQELGDYRRPSEEQEESESSGGDEKSLSGWHAKRICGKGTSILNVIAVCTFLALCAVGLTFKDVRDFLKSVIYYCFPCLRQRFEPKEEKPSFKERVLDWVSLIIITVYEVVLA